MGLAVGIAAPSIASQVKDRFRDQSTERAVHETRSDTLTNASLSDVATNIGADSVIPTTAPTPTDAVQRFLAAESGGEHATSYALLSDADRALYRSPAAWRAAHATMFPIVGFDVRAVDVARSLVRVDLRYRSTIDEVVGVVPARANVTWPAVPQHGGWLVDFSNAEVRAELPPDADAATAAFTWASQRQRCAPADEYSAGLVGRATLADKLCRKRGAHSTGPVTRLEASDATAFVSAFGASATAWARAVALAGPVPMTVVLAPVADKWLVVGVLEPR